MGTSWLLEDFYFGSVDCCRTVMVKILLNWWNFRNYSSTQRTYGEDGDGLLRACVRNMGSDGSNSIVLQQYCKVLQYFGIAKSQSNVISIANSQIIAINFAKFSKYCKNYCKYMKILQKILQCFQNIAKIIAKSQKNCKKYCYIQRRGNF